MNAAPGVASQGTVPASVPAPDTVSVYWCLVCGPIMRFHWDDSDDEITWHRVLPHPFRMHAEDDNPQ